MTVLQFRPRPEQPTPHQRPPRQSWPDVACEAVAPITPAYPCMRPVPQPNGKPREHQKHWWTSKVDGVVVHVHWETR
jgi:hypothetical protein